uniref:Uncharacterized protein n=1 Tax=Candidatus Kentrum sp. TC TaxID=2126339 RepID=A0A450YC45_9GAMM|nr:MAG: hypothetical protein BECKTC1821E_GA0114239_100391 [Candidatus Kentron sp. TC]
MKRTGCSKSKDEVIEENAKALTEKEHISASRQDSNGVFLARASEFFPKLEPFVAMALDFPRSCYSQRLTGTRKVAGEGACGMCLVEEGMMRFPSTAWKTAHGYRGMPGVETKKPYS